jgi:hypothetical protein
VYPYPNHEVAQQKLVQVFSLISLLTSFILLGIIIFFSSLLRPIADDYVYASIFSEFGLLSPLTWFERWTGDIFLTSVATILLGLPLALLPLELGSSLAFIVAIFGVGVFTIQVLSTSAALPTRALLMAAPWISISWLTAFWIAAEVKLPELDAPFGLILQNANRDQEFLALGITHWQTINVGYLTVPATLLVLMFVLYRHGPTRLTTRWGLMSIVGLPLGASPLLGISSMVFIPLAFLMFSREFHRLRWVQDSAAVLVGTVAGLVFSLASPGAIIRREAIHQGMAIDYLEKLMEAIQGLPQALVDWIVASASLFSISAIVFGLVLGLVFLGANSSLVDSKLVVRLILVFLISSLVIFLVNSALSKVTYLAWWQTLTGRLFIFVAATMFGVWLGLKVKESIQFKNKIVFIALAFVTLAGLSSFVACSALIDSIITRHGQWAVGDAPLGGITDISSEWVLDAARKVNNPFWAVFVERLD